MAEAPNRPRTQAHGAQHISATRAPSVDSGGQASSQAQPARAAHNSTSAGGRDVEGVREAIHRTYR